MIWAEKYIKIGEIDKVLKIMERTGIVEIVNISEMLAREGKYQEVLEFIEKKFDP